MLIGGMLTALATSLVPSSIATGAEAPECADVYVIGARGSGEHSEGGEHSMGPKVWSFTQELRRVLALANMTVEPVGVSYQALKADGLPYTIVPFTASIETGILLANDALQEIVSRCKDSADVVLAGYSQGAMVMHNLESRSLLYPAVAAVDATVLIADGDWTAYTSAAHRLGTAPHRAAGVRSFDLSRWTRPDNYLSVLPEDVAVPGHTWDVCNADDYVCDFSLLRAVGKAGRDAKATNTKSYAALLPKAARQVARSLAPPLQIMLGHLPEATVGRPYAARVSATGGAPSTYRWSLSDGAPTWLDIDPVTGLLTGVPPRATDLSIVPVALQDDLGLTTSRHLSLTVNAAAPQRQVVAGPDGANVFHIAAPSADGRYLLLTDSFATQLWRHDRTDGSNLAMFPNSDVGTNARSATASISDDGNTMAFSSFASNLTDITRLGLHIYVRDVLSGNTREVGVGIGGVRSDGDDQLLDMSGDGRYVLFSSTARNLVPRSDAIGSQALLRKDMHSGQIMRVDPGLPDQDADGRGHVDAGWISDDGNTVAYSAGIFTASSATNPYAYIRNVTSGHARRLRLAKDGDLLEWGLVTDISGDGRRVALRGFGYDGNWGQAVAVLDAETGDPISVQDENAMNVKLSRDGMIATYSARDYQAAEQPTTQVYRHEVDGGHVELLTKTADGEAGAATSTVPHATVSADGRVVVVTTTQLNLLSEPQRSQGRGVLTEIRQ